MPTLIRKFLKEDKSDKWTIPRRKSEQGQIYDFGYLRKHKSEKGKLTKIYQKETSMRKKLQKRTILKKGTFES